MKVVPYTATNDLHLATSVRFHFAAALSEWAAGIVNDQPDVARLASIASALRGKGYQLRVTRTLRAAKEFLWKKYENLPDARFGLLHSSRDKRIKESIDLSSRRRYGWIGPWYADSQLSPNSCRSLREAITEFEAQGLELDHTLLIWGIDFFLNNGLWDDSLAKKYQKSSRIHDALQLRRNAYRVLLTRGREGVIICIPSSIRELDATFDLLLSAGCQKVI